MLQLSDKGKQRFLKRCEEAIRDPITDCLIWQGYNRIRINNVFYVPRRLIYHLFVSPINEKMNVYPKCDNDKCINPHHMTRSNFHRIK